MGFTFASKKQSACTSVLPVQACEVSHPSVPLPSPRTLSFFYFLAETLKRRNIIAPRSFFWHFTAAETNHRRNPNPPGVCIQLDGPRGCRSIWFLGFFGGQCARSLPCAPLSRPLLLPHTSASAVLHLFMSHAALMQRSRNIATYIYYTKHTHGIPKNQPTILLS